MRRELPWCEPNMRNLPNNPSRPEIPVLRGIGSVSRVVKMNSARPQN